MHIIEEPLEQVMTMITRYKSVLLFMHEEQIDPSSALKALRLRSTNLKRAKIRRRFDAEINKALEDDPEFRSAVEAAIEKKTA
jgi:hypothetical protein